MDELHFELDELTLAGPSKGKERWESDGEEEGGRAAGGEEEEECASEPGDLTCAICLANIPLEDLAMVKGCDHMYCIKCILEWCVHKEEPWCPQCKAPFSYLLTYRTLDGTLQDFPCEESVCLLKRARWFEDHMKATEKGKALLEESRLQDDTAWQDWAEDFDLASDEEIEAFYFSSAAGRARCVLGNRRFGEGGYIANGRRQAMPRRMRGKGTGKGGKTGEHAVVNTPQAAPPAASFRTPNAGGGRQRAGAPLAAPTPSAGAGPSGAAYGGPASAPRSISAPGTSASHAAAGPLCSAAAAGGPYGSSPAGRSVFGTSPTAARAIYGSSPSGAAALYGTSPGAAPGSGRRARRNARRAAQDLAGEALAF